MELSNVLIPFEVEDQNRDQPTRWDIRIESGKIAAMKPSDHAWTASHPPDILIPPLCHTHIHLDKAYLLNCNHPSSPNHPDYSDLVPQSGTFQEALANTSEAKKRYTADDLYLRGSQLLATSYSQGVTSLRAFVELDHVTGLEPLRTAVRLRRDFAHLINVQICVFAQDPVFSTARGRENRSIISAALDDAQLQSSIEVIGTTPYVEEDEQSLRQNIQWAIQKAIKHDLHLDFHIEYNLKGGDKVMDTFIYLVDTLIANSWPTGNGSRTVVLGHATRLTLASHPELSLLSERINSASLPIHFVGLPTSDLFMMGRSEQRDTPLSRPCGTLNVPKMIKEYKLNACLSVNNVGNAFTPYGNGDPLGLACWGVGLYHAGTVNDARLLYEAVSTRAKQAIMPSIEEETVYTGMKEGDPWKTMLLVRNEGLLEVGRTTGTSNIVQVQARPRLTMNDVVWDPPETRLRSVIQ